MEDTQNILDDLSDFHFDHGDREIQKRVSDESVALDQECTQIIEKAQSLAVAAASNYRDRQGKQHTNADQRNKTEREITDEDDHDHNPNSNEKEFFLAQEINQC